MILLGVGFLIKMFEMLEEFEVSLYINKKNRMKFACVKVDHSYYIDSKSIDDILPFQTPSFEKMQLNLFDRCLGKSLCHLWIGQLRIESICSRLQHRIYTVVANVV